METRVCVIGLIKQGDKILLGQKPPGRGPCPDTWHMPGGGLEMGKESCEEALTRELKEETGLDVKIIKDVAWDTDTEPNKHGIDTYYIFLQYLCEPSRGEVRAGDDLYKLEWVDIKDLHKYNINRPAKRLLQRMGILTKG